MSSEKQKIVNRLNAGKSTGPRSAAGKLRSSQNALKHGMLSKHVVVLEEDPAEFGALLKSLQEEWKPVTTMQRILVERMAAHQWKLLRVARAEAELFTQFRLETNINLTHLRRNHKPKHACTPAVLESLIGNEEHCEIMLLQQYEHREERAMQSCVRQMMVLKKYEAEFVESNDEVEVEFEVETAASAGTQSMEKADSLNEAISVVTDELSDVSMSDDTLPTDPPPTEIDRSPHLARELARGEPASIT